MRCWKIVCAALLLGLLTAQTAAADAFTLDERHFLGRLGVSYCVLSQYRDDDGVIVNSPNNLFYRDIGGHLWLRFGVFEAMEVGAYQRFRGQYLSVNDPITDKIDEATSNKFGDLDLDVKARLVGGPRWAVSVDGLVKLPYFYDKKDDLPPGDGQLDVEGRVLAAMKFSLFTGGIDGGYRFRAGEPADLWLYGAELGFNFNIVYGRARLDGYASARNQDRNAKQYDFMHGPDYALGQAMITFGVLPTNWFGIDFTATYPIYGRNVAQGLTYMLASSITF
jgi:hypothetical protein